MGAAKVADADVLLVVNVEWGGAFAYTLGTVELIPEEDRRRIKGIIFNNVRGDPGRFRIGIPEFERVCGVPVLGVIPHGDFTLPSEDSEALRSVRSMGHGKCVIGAVRYPRIANFTDLDPLFLEDVTVVFAERPEDLDGVDAVVLPGTKNTIQDLRWMESTGIADRVRALRGKVPIVGICGGFQMMGSELEDPEGLEGGVPGTYRGLGLFDMTTRFGDYSKRVVNSEGRMLVGDGGDITGYELHMGMSDVREEPLFEITNNFDRGPVTDGAARDDEMLYGTYLHGVFDRRPFRAHFLSKVSHGGRPYDASDARDYDEILEENLERLADVFESNMDMGAVLRLLGVSE